MIKRLKIQFPLDDDDHFELAFRVKLAELNGTICEVRDPKKHFIQVPKCGEPHLKTTLVIPEEWWEDVIEKSAYHIAYEKMTASYMYSTYPGPHKWLREDFGKTIWNAAIDCVIQCTTPTMEMYKRILILREKLK